MQLVPRKVSQLLLASLLLGFSLIAVGCGDDDEVDPAIRDSARKQRESMGSGNKAGGSKAMEAGQPGAPPGGLPPEAGAGR